MRSDAAAELIIWDLLAGKRDQAAADSNLPDVPPSPQLVLARFTAHPEQPLPFRNGPESASVTRQITGPKF